MSADGMRYAGASGALTGAGVAESLIGRSVNVHPYATEAPTVDGEMGNIASRIDQYVGVAAALGNRAHSLADRLVGEVSPGVDNSKVPSHGYGGALGRVYDRLDGLDRQLVTLALAIDRLERL